MRITTKLTAISSATIAALVTLVPFLIQSISQSTSARNDLELADKIEARFLEQSSLRDQYFLHHEDRLRMQWEENKKVCDQLLRQAKDQFRHEQDQKILERLLNESQEISAIFPRLVSNHELLKLANRNREIQAELDKRLSSQMLLKASVYHDSVNELNRLSSQRVEQTYRYLATVAAALMVALIIAVLLLSTNLIRLIRKRLVPLHEAAKIIGGGNLTYQIKSDGTDEFSDLAQSINAMSSALATESSVREQAEQALEKSEKLYRVMLEDQTEVIIRFKADNTIIYVNDAFCRMFGKTRDGLIGSTWSPVVFGEDLSLVNEKLGQLTPANPVVTIENRIVTGQGTIRWGQFVNRAIFDDKNDLIEIQAVGRDVTERKQVEEELAVTAREMEDLYNNAPCGYHSVGPDGTFLRINDTELAWFGCRREDVIGKRKISDFYTPASQEAFQRVFPEFVRAGNVSNEEFDLIANDGTIRNISLSASAIRDQDGKFLMSRSVMYDITGIKKAQQILQRESEKNLALLRNASDGITILDYDGNLVEVSDSFCNMLGYSRDELIGMNVSQWDTGFADHETMFKTFRQQFDKPVRSLFESRHKRKDGSIYDVEITGFPIVLEGEKLLYNSSRDITERKKTEVELELAATIFQNSSEAMMVADAKGSIITVNPAFTELTGYAAQEAIGKNFNILNSGHHDHAYFKTMQNELAAINHWQGEIRNRRKDGEVFVEWLTINAILNDDGTVKRYVALFSDVTEKKKSEERIWKQANYDSLTGLPNRRMFHDRLEQEIKRAHRAKSSLALLFLDLDYFKEVNDRLGHDMGDKLLKDVAQRLSSCVRDSDTVARLGGDEFTIILSDLAALESVERIASSIVEKLAVPFQLGDAVANVSASIGIAIYPNDSTDIPSLLKNADLAMYAAKRHGRNQFHFYVAAMRENDISFKDPVK